MLNPFFSNHGPFKIKDIIEILSASSSTQNLDAEVIDIKDLSSANKGCITFFHSKKYKTLAKNTNASFCITTENLKDQISDNCIVLIVKNVLVAVGKITKFFYPDSVNDEFDNSVLLISKTKFKDYVKYGHNVLVGKNIKIGKNCIIGHNTIIEKNVIIGDNCTIGSNTIIRNTFIKNNVFILDNCVIGKKGFGFFPDNISNFKYPHIGMVIINDFAEIGCGSTIDRGSMSNTIIGQNTYLDNQIHIAHNVQIGNNTIIAGQVGIAGSTIVGNNVKIGGQAGISGHLKIGNNVEIGGGSGVIKNIPDNSKVMGYPTKNIREFLKDNR
jgi:UDP-3-O-[3-hydroxymyristoyl] glucosamine N-acyltransferase